MKRRLVILLLLALLTVAAAVAVRYRSCFFATSEVFRRYEHAQGIEADYIRSYPINDTLRLDMTILVADDSLAFADLLKSWGRSDEFIHDMMTINEVTPDVDINSRLSKRHPKGHPELSADPDNNNNEVVAIFPYRLTVAIFHTTDASQVMTVMYANNFKEVNI